MWLWCFLVLGYEMSARWRRNNYARKLLTLLVSLALPGMCAYYTSVRSSSSRIEWLLLEKTRYFSLSYQLLHINYILCDASLHILIHRRFLRLFIRFGLVVSNQHLPSIFSLFYSLYTCFESLKRSSGLCKTHNFNWFNLILYWWYEQKLPVKIKMHMKEICFFDIFL
jgi:hypothetical protein